MRPELHALELWRHALVASVRRDAPDLSARQMALLLSVYLEDCDHTVRGLAKTLGISKPAISRALDRLGELGYIRRERDDMDRRNVLVQRTLEGGAFLRDFAALIVAGKRETEPLPARHVAFLADPSVIGSSSVTSSLAGDFGAETSWPMAAAPVDVAA